MPRSAGAVRDAIGCTRLVPRSSRTSTRSRSRSSPPRYVTRSAKGTADDPDPNVKAKAGLNRAILDAGFGMLGTLIGEKGAHAACTVIDVDPGFTSQTSAQCGHVRRNVRGCTLRVCQVPSRRRRRQECCACDPVAGGVAAHEIRCSSSTGRIGRIEFLFRLKNAIG